MINKKSGLLVFFILIVVTLSGCGLKNDTTEVSAVKDDSEIIFFYGDTCPHCKTVEEYFEKNKTAEKFQFSQREVYRDKANASLLSEKAKKCGIADDSLGVPFLWAKEKCYIGQNEVIKFFEDKLKNNE